MSWISPDQLADVILHAMLLPNSSLRADADRQLRQWRQEAMNFGDCCMELVAAPFNLNQNQNNNNELMFGQFFPNSSQPLPNIQNNDSNHNNVTPLSLAFAASFILNELSSPNKWLEAQNFSDKPHVVKLFHKIAFFASRTNNNNSNASDYDFPSSCQNQNSLSPFSSIQTNTCLEHKIAKNILDCLAGVVVAEFPNQVWTNFIYCGEAEQGFQGRAASSSSASAAAGSQTFSNSNSNSNSRAPSFCSGSNNNNINTNDVLPTSRRYVWMELVSQKLKRTLKASETISDEKIQLRLALLDYLENAMKSSSSSGNLHLECFQWKLTKTFISQIPSSKQANFPVVRSIVLEAANRILNSDLSQLWCFGIDVQNIISNSDNSEHEKLKFVASYLATTQSQILLLKAASWDVVKPLAELLIRSVSVSDPSQISSALPAPLWKSVCDVLFSFLEKNPSKFCGYDDDDENETSNDDKAIVPISIMLKLMSQMLIRSPSSEEIFENISLPIEFSMNSNRSNKSNNNNVAAGGDDDEDNEQFEDNTIEATLFRCQSPWQPLSFQTVASRLSDFYSSSNSNANTSSSNNIEEYLSDRENALVNDIKELDGGITGICVGNSSLTQVCIAIVESIVETAPTVAANCVGQIVSELLSSSIDTESSHFITHGCCTLLLSAFRVFHVCGSSSFSSAVCSSDASFLFEKLMEKCDSLLSNCVATVNNNSRQQQQQQQQNEQDYFMCWDATFVACRLLIVSAILCEHQGGDENVDKRITNFVDFVMSILVSSRRENDDTRFSILNNSNNSQKQNTFHQYLMTSVRAACAFSISRISMKSPAVRSRVEGIIDDPGRIPLFQTALQDHNHDPLTIPFTLSAITELVVCIMELGQPQHIEHLWKSNVIFFRGFLGNLAEHLATASMQVGDGPLAACLKKLLRTLVSGHFDYISCSNSSSSGETSSSSSTSSTCAPFQAVFSPLVTSIQHNQSTLESPAGRIVCDSLRELYMIANNDNNDAENNNNNTRNDVVSLCNCGGALYSEAFAQLTLVSIHDAESRATDGTIRFASNCAATIAATFQDFTSNEHSIQVLLRLVGLYTSNFIISSSNNVLLLSRTLSHWGFAASFCLRRLSMLQHPAATPQPQQNQVNQTTQTNQHLSELATSIMSQICSFVRISTKDCDLSGICFLIATIGQIDLVALTQAMYQLSSRDVSLFWSLWTSICCNFKSEKVFKPTKQIWLKWFELTNNNNSNSNNNNNDGCLNLTANVGCSVFIPVEKGGTTKKKKISKHSIVSDDLSTLGIRCETPSQALELVQEFRNSNEFEAMKVYGQDMFSEGCFKSLF